DDEQVRGVGRDRVERRAVGREVVGRLAVHAQLVGGEQGDDLGEVVGPGAPERDAAVEGREIVHAAILPQSRVLIRFIVWCDTTRDTAGNPNSFMWCSS